MRFAPPGIWRFSRTRAWCAAVCAIAAVWLLGDGGAPRPNLGANLTRERLVRNFDVIVFHNEFDSRTDDYLRKWVVPVRIFLDIRAGDPQLIQETVARHVRHLVEITGFDIALVGDKADANVVAVFDRQAAMDQIRRRYFAPSYDLNRVLQTNLCIGHYESNDRYEIVSAVVVMPIDRVMARGRLEACVVEEMTQILGLPNDSDDVVPSVFNDHSDDIELTGQDILLVKLLFDPRLEAGMSRPYALEKVREILGEMGFGDGKGRP